MKYIYLHGFASSPQSYKAQYLKRCFGIVGINLEILDLNQGDFSNLTLTRQIEQTVAAFENTNTPVTLIGSSLGAFTATWVGEKYPQVKGLILLAPAFDFLSHWLPKLGKAQFKQWQDSGYLSIYHYGENKLLSLGYDFFIDGEKYHQGLFINSIPTLIIHGKRDETIPVAASIEYAQNRSNVKLITPDSDHSLHDQMEFIWEEIKSFCAIKQQNDYGKP